MGFEIHAGAAMSAHTPKKTNLVDVSLVAAVELEELLQGARADAPTFGELITKLKDPRPTRSGLKHRNMLADVRNLSVVKNSLNTNLHLENQDREQSIQSIAGYLSELLDDVGHKRPTGIEKAKNFCLKFNRNLLAKAYEDLETRYLHKSRLRESDVD